MTRFERRVWPITVSAAFVVLSLLYVFQWANVVNHQRFQWLPPGDFVKTYQGAVALAHGHLSDIYKTNVAAFVSFPGILFALIPIGALSGSFHVTALQIQQHHHVLAHPVPLSFTQGTLYFPGKFTLQDSVYVAQPWWIAAALPYVLILTCIVFFACDALAERLGVSKTQRAVLAVVEGVLLWNVVVIWGHPEDAIALALAVYALVFALDGRFTGAAWIFGAAVAFQPLVLVILPVILVLAGWPRGIGVLVRSAIPAIAIALPPLVASFGTTTRAFLKQPNYPTRDHVTPWTSLAPVLSHRGRLLAVASGPGRIVAIVLAIGVGIFGTRRWRDRPDLVVCVCAVTLTRFGATQSP